MLLPGLVVELCDLEDGESALLHDGDAWYRSSLEDVLNCTEPRVRVRGQI